ncbi:MAG: hypothetical protein NTW03_02750 [Verrucomicrobia bacterium]|nr:hypothetical protein [Verrucomicrobiota bacterium]
MTPDGYVRTIAGPGYVWGADGFGAAAHFDQPFGMAVDSAGSVFVADGGNAIIRKGVFTYGEPVVLTLPQDQTATEGYTSNITFQAQIFGALPLACQWQRNGVDIPGATNATLTLPTACLTNAGAYRLVVSGSGGTAVSGLALLAVQPALTLTTLAGQAGISGSADGVGTNALFSGAAGVAVDAAGNAYVADISSHTIRKLAPTGAVTTLAGKPGVGGSANGVGTNALFNQPCGLAADGTGNVYVTELVNHDIRKITPAGIVTTLAGLTGTSGSADGVGSAAQFNAPRGLAVDLASNLFVADSYNHTIRKITPDGTVSTIAGLAANTGSADGVGNAARFNLPSLIALDRRGTLYVTDAGNQTIRRLTPDASGTIWTVSTLAGLAGSTGSTDGMGSDARFNNSRGIAVDGTGNVYVADRGNNTIRKITPAGVVTTVAGLPGVAGYLDGVGLGARLNGLYGLALDPAGNLYVTDYGNNLLRIGWFDTGATTPPMLQITRLPGQVVLAWPASAAGFVLETSGMLAPGAVWTPLTNALSLDGTNLVRTNATTDPAAFFRLRQ